MGGSLSSPVHDLITLASEMEIDTKMDSTKEVITSRGIEFEAVLRVTASVRCLMAFLAFLGNRGTK